MQNVLKSLARICMVETKSSCCILSFTRKDWRKRFTETPGTGTQEKRWDFFPHLMITGDMDAFIYKFKTLNTEKACWSKDPE